jgi:hypothetical protein
MQIVADSSTLDTRDTSKRVNAHVTFEGMPSSACDAVRTNG